jgi:hypothetical protein
MGKNSGYGSGFRIRDSGSGIPDPGFRIRDSGSGMNKPDHVSEAKKPFQILKRNSSRIYT